MKRFIFLTSLFVFVLATNPTLAVAATSTTAATPTPDQKLNQQINQLKDKIASRVSELNLVEKRGIIGVVLEVKSNQITITDSNGDPRYVDVDEITKFSSATNKSSFGISDLTKGTRVSILGLYNKESKRILARFIDTQVVPTRYDGVIATIDTKNLQFTLATDDKKQANIDIATTTKINSYNKDAGLVKYGFSKLVVGDRVSVLGYPDKKDPTLLVADRVIDFLNVPKDPNVVISISTPTPSAEPTSAGAKNIKPIK
jgi:hypothetical protein